MPKKETEELGSYCVTTHDVLVDEYRQIWADNKPIVSMVDYYRAANSHNQSALCLSGGGIRSAAVGLGVLQALSRGRLLTSFQYLSTVSGGGYIGSWLQRWIHERNGNATEVMECLAGNPSYVSNASDPARIWPVNSADLSRIEPDEVRHLRENSNFITPRVGIGSNDTWTAVAISVRNILINWLLFAPLFLALATAPNLYLDLLAAVRPAGIPPMVAVLLPLLSATGLIAWATASTVRLMPSYRGKPRAEAQRDEAKKAGGDAVLNRRIVWPLLGWAGLATLSLSAELLGRGTEPLLALPVLGPKASLDLAVFSLAGMIAGLLFGWFGLDQKYREGQQAAGPDAAIEIETKGYAETFRKDGAIWPISFLVVTLWIALGANLFAGALSDSRAWAAVTLAIAGPIWLLTGTLLGAVVFVAFRTSEGPRIEPDSDREWLGRLSAVKLKPMLLWAVLAGAVLLLNRLAGTVKPGDSTVPITELAALISGLVAVFGGRSGKTASAEQERRSGTSTVMKAGRSLVKYLPMGAIISLATAIFIVALLILFGRLEYALAGNLAAGMTALDTRFGWGLSPWIGMVVIAHVILFALVLGLIGLFGRRICVNRFSLHGFYRNRLARAFLGAARPTREPDPFTGFDSGDNVRLHQLKPVGEDGRRVLFPVINVALNVTATKNLAWQERKAMPFVFTPRHCGSRMLDPANRQKGDEPPGAYVTADSYAGREPDFGMQARKVEARADLKGCAGPVIDVAKALKEAEKDDRGVSLATAMAISGAAATPNMGYYSSPATAFLMTLFNVRLGAWLPNPALAPRAPGRVGALASGAKHTDVSRSSPTNSIKAIFNEMIGRSHDHGPDVYLSDGGHFENLALYEMIQRRCRYMVVSDAGADPEFGLKDLGNAVRKVKIDLDVDISFSELRLSRRGQPHDPPPQLAWALGKVTYPEIQIVSDGNLEKPENLKGTILYLKPSFFGDQLPVDVVAYGRGRADFPHESTVDQFFSESQFESYRRLADHFLSGLIGHAQNKNGNRKVTIAELFQSLENQVEERAKPDN